MRYKDIAHQYAKRRKNAATKRLEGGQIRQEPDGSFVWALEEWDWQHTWRGPNHMPAKKHTDCLIFYSNDTAVLVAPQSYMRSQTLHRRLEKLLRVSVFSDKTSFQNYEVTSRVVETAYSSQRRNLPLTPGMKFLLRFEGASVLEHAADIKRVKNPDAVQAVKAKIEEVRKLMSASAALGTFDTEVTDRLVGATPRPTRAILSKKDLARVNVDQPTYDDAKLLFSIGMAYTSLPESYAYDSIMGKYVSVPGDVRFKQFKRRAIANALSFLRDYIYAQLPNAYDRVTVGKA